MGEAVMAFRGDYDFLSNMFEAPFTWDGRTYRNSEAAFQSAKTLDPAERARFSEMAGVPAKRAGKRVRLREDWEQVKEDVMEEVLRAKFSQNPALLRRLADTGDLELQEGNRWHDTYWGVDAATGRGRNRLGRILMRLRSEALGIVLREATVTERVSREEREQLALAERQKRLDAMREELNALSWPALEGRELRTRAFGTGTVLRLEGNVLHVSVGGQEKRFLLPDGVLQGHLLPEDANLTEACRRYESLRKQIRDLERAELPDPLPGPLCRERTAVTRLLRYTPDPRREAKQPPERSLNGTAIFLREGKALSATAKDTLRHLCRYQSREGAAVLLSGRTFMPADEPLPPLRLLELAEREADRVSGSMPDFSVYDMDDGCGLLQMQGIFALSPNGLLREASGSLLPALNLRSECRSACDAAEILALVYFRAEDCLAGRLPPTQ